MAYIVNFDQSNKADWAFDISATDADTGVAIDFTGALVTLVLKDENDCQKLTASIGSGITLIQPTVLEVIFTASQMNGLQAGAYKVGSVYSLNGQINQLFSGTVSIYDGIAQI
jgi:hypothetical protein